jgi:IclR family acetate operon transcriptional repressor
MLKNDKVIVVDRIQNLNIDLLTHRLGLDIPIHSTSIGKVLLAYLPVGKQDKILRSTNLVKFTEATLTDQKLIKKTFKTHYRKRLFYR